MGGHELNHASRLSLRSGKPYVLEKRYVLLTSSILKSRHNLISLIFLYKSYSVATPRYPRPLLLENYMCNIALMPDL
jgi:hypothetical protein